jgi:hypothetical protein
MIDLNRIRRAVERYRIVPEDMLHGSQRDVIALLAEVDRLRGIAEEAVGWLPYHDPSHPDYEGEISDVGRRLRAELQVPQSERQDG